MGPPLVHHCSLSSRHGSCQHSSLIKSVSIPLAALFVIPLQDSTDQLDSLTAKHSTAENALRSEYSKNTCGLTEVPAMWRMQYGDRALEGSEAIVFAEALLSLLDEAILFKFVDYKLGVQCFDNLTYGQKISVLVIIGNGLLRKDVPSVRPTAVLEGAIASVFEHLKNKITLEIEMPKFGTSWRELVIAARKKLETEDIPDLTCDDLEEWETEVQKLSHAILWGVDYDDDQLYIDFPLEKSKQLSDWAGTSDDYFLIIADDLTDKEAKARIKELQNLCHSIIKLS